MSTAVCFVGDLHAGSKTALANQFTLDDKDTYIPSAHQFWLLECWNDMNKWALARSSGCDDFVLCLGGDMADGVQHHQTTQTFGTEKDQINLAAELLRTLNKRATKRFGLRGTSAHGGNGANLDRAIYEELGFKRENIDYSHRLSIDGALLDWRHHTNAPRLPHTRGNSLSALIAKTHMRCLESNQPIPDLIVRHHVHLYDDRIDHRRGMRAINCPAWQLPTEYTHGLPDDQVFSIGALLWFPSQMRVESRLYDAPIDPVKYV